MQNLAFGRPEDLPFDLRQKRGVRYTSPEDAPSRADARKGLQAQLKEALALMLTDAEIRPATQYPVNLAIEYEDKIIRSERHICELRVMLTNRGTKTVTAWHIDVTMPTRRLEAPGDLIICVHYCPAKRLCW